MGAFYGSIHLHTADVELAVSTVQKLCSGTKNRFLVSPCIRGWISIFPSDHGADFSHSELIAGETRVPTLHCAVHDDDVFVYRVYHAGRLIDEYSSNPACFDESVERGAPPVGGGIEPLERLVPLAGKGEELVRLLKAPHSDFIFEQERLRRFAELIGLPNACTSYEYLQQGEHDGITRWREFVHVPDLSAEKAAKKAEAARIRAELKALQSEGVLIRELKQSFRLIDPITSELMLTEKGERFGERKPQRILALPKPWTGQPQDTGFDLPANASETAISSTGRWIGVGHAYGRWPIQLWDRQTSTCVFEKEHKSAVSSVLFSSDDKLMISRSQNEVFIISVPEARLLQVFDVGYHGQAAALHPNGNYLIADARQFWRATWLDKPGMVQQLRREPETLQAATSEYYRAVLALIQTRNDEKLLNEAGSDKVEEACRQWEAIGAAIKEFSGHVFALRFTRDGSHLVCGTSEGLLVFNTEEIITAHDHLPRARFSFGLERKIPRKMPEVYPQLTDSPYIYSFAEDSVQSRIVFGGGQGALFYLNLADGSSGELFRPPEPNRIYNIVLAPDRSALIYTALPPPDKKTPRGKGKAKVQIWNYEALCRRCGLPYAPPVSEH